MKAKELIKMLRILSKNINFDPDVCVEIDGVLKPVVFAGACGTASDDYPEQTSPRTTQSATAILRIV